MFSLAGIPPLAGFFAKFYVFLAAIEAQLYALAVIGVVASVVGAYYYLRIVKIMYFDEPAPRRSTATCGASVAAIASSARGCSRCSSSSGSAPADRLRATARRRRSCRDHAGRSGYAPRRNSTRSTPPMKKRAASPTRASAARSGSARRTPDRGRGRRGRAGNRRPAISPRRCCSRPASPRGECAQLSFVAALAAADTVAQLRAGRRRQREMAERCAGRRAQDRGHPARIRERSGAASGLARHRHRHQSRARIRTDTEFPATSLPALGVAAPPPRHALLELAGALREMV